MDLQHKSFTAKQFVCVCVRACVLAVLFCLRKEMSDICDVGIVVIVVWCNACKYIEGKRQINICLVFINLDLERKFDNSTRATCISFIDLV